MQPWIRKTVDRLMVCKQVKRQRKTFHFHFIASRCMWDPSHPGIRLKMWIPLLCRKRILLRKTTTDYDTLSKERKSPYPRDMNLHSLTKCVEIKEQLSKPDVTLIVFAPSTLLKLCMESMFSHPTKLMNKKNI